MHELSFAQQILWQTEEAAGASGLKKISVIKIVLGELLYLMPEALNFSFQVLKKGTIADEARLLVEYKKALAQCDASNNQYSWLEHGYNCPRCKSQEIRIIQGMEMLIEYVEGE
jgi:hydrogenase nickel incorporation protein HypA/HybF